LKVFEDWIGIHFSGGKGKGIRVKKMKHRGKCGKGNGGLSALSCYGHRLALSAATPSLRSVVSASIAQPLGKWNTLSTYAAALLIPTCDIFETKNRD
jgi:hypothetical protein